eukprot:9292531-Pyramimonas_sp.AAC.2
MSGGGACNLCHWGRRWNCLRGNEPCEGHAERGGGDACNLCHWNLRWSSLWGNEPCEGVPKLAAVTNATNATGAFGGHPNGATNRARGVQRWRVPSAPLGPSVELPAGPQAVREAYAMGGGGACNLRHWGHSVEPPMGPRTVREGGAGKCGGAQP